MDKARGMQEENKHLKPLECIDCKKKNLVCYKTIVNGKRTVQMVCDQCPMLLKRVKGIEKLEDELIHEFLESGIACQNCDTNIAEIIKEGRLGCIQCYTLFQDILLQDLVHNNYIASHPTHLDALNPNCNLHIGKSSMKKDMHNLTHHIASLNEALKDAIKFEHYEDAAALRDEISTTLKKKYEK